MIVHARTIPQRYCHHCAHHRPLPLPYGGTNHTRHHHHAAPIPQPPPIASYQEHTYTLAIICHTAEEAHTYAQTHIAHPTRHAPPLVAVRLANNRLAVYAHSPALELEPTTGHEVTEFWPVPALALMEAAPPPVPAHYLTQLGDPYHDRTR